MCIKLFHVWNKCGVIKQNEFVKILVLFDFSYIVN